MAGALAAQRNGGEAAPLSQQQQGEGEAAASTESAATFLTPADRTETEVLAVGSLSTSEEMSEESQPPPPQATAQQAGSEGSAGVENGAWVGVGERAGVGLVEAEAEEGRAETGVVAEAGSGVSLALLRMYKEVAERSGSGSDKTEKTGEIKAGGGWGEGREGEGGGESKSGREREKAEERGEIGGRHGRMSAGDDGLGNRRVISIPPGAEGTTDNVKQPSLKLVIAREAPTISEDGQCSNRNVSDIEGPGVEAPASPGSDSSHASAGRRASLIKHQVCAGTCFRRKNEYGYVLDRIPPVSLFSLLAFILLYFVQLFWGTQIL